MSASSLHRESTDSLIYIYTCIYIDQARSQDFEGEVSADGAHAQCICAHAYAHCLTHYDVTPPLHITCMKKSMKYTYTNKCL